MNNVKKIIISKYFLNPPLPVLQVHIQNCDRKYDNFTLYNAPFVRFQNTFAAKSFKFSNIIFVSTDNSFEIGGSKNQALELINSSIDDVTAEDYKILKAVKFTNSSTKIINLGNIAEIDLLDNSTVSSLNVTVTSGKSFFNNSTIDHIKYFVAKNPAIFDMEGVTVGKITYMMQETKKITYHNTRIMHIEKNAIGITAIGTLIMENCTIEELSDAAITVNGSLEIHDSVIRSSSDKGIILQGNGSLLLKNVEINGKIQWMKIQSIAVHESTNNISSNPIIPFHVFIPDPATARPFWISIGVLISIIIVLLLIIILGTFYIVNTILGTVNNDGENNLRDDSKNLYSPPPPNSKSNDQLDEQNLSHGIDYLAPSVNTEGEIPLHKMEKNETVQANQDTDPDQPMYDDVQCEISNFQNKNNSLTTSQPGQKMPKVDFKPTGNVNSIASLLKKEHVVPMKGTPILPPISSLPSSDQYMKGKVKPPPPPRGVSKPSFPAPITPKPMIQQRPMLPAPHSALAVGRLPHISALHPGPLKSSVPLVAAQTPLGHFPPGNNQDLDDDFYDDNEIQPYETTEEQPEGIYGDSEEEPVYA